MRERDRTGSLERDLGGATQVRLGPYAELCRLDAEAEGGNFRVPPVAALAGDALVVKLHPGMRCFSFHTNRETTSGQIHSKWLKVNDDELSRVVQRILRDA